MDKDIWLIKEIKSLKTKEKIDIDNIEKKFIYKDFGQVNNFKDLFREKEILPSSSNLASQSTPPNTTNVSSVNGRYITSPISLAGKIYEMDRGVIGISRTGELGKVNMDDNDMHHDEATVLLGDIFGTAILATTPFLAAVEVTKSGHIIIQCEGDKCFIYLPQEVSKSQAILLYSELRPRDAFNFSFVHGEYIAEEQQISQIMNFVASITREEINQVSRRYR